MPDPDALGAALGYLAAVRNRGEAVELRGQPVGPLRPSEVAAIGRFMADWIAQRQAENVELAVDLEPDARKSVVVFLGILPLLEVTLQDGMKGILYLASDGAAEAGANLDYLSMMILQPPVRFGTWEQIAARRENGYRPPPLSGLWVIGDLDWSGAPVGEPARSQRLEGLGRARRTPGCRRILLHQQGRETLAPYPLEPAKAKPKPCFIATAACGSADAWEVEALRAFRERRLRPSFAGRRAIALYETLSPPLARWIASRPRVRAWVRRALIRPLARRLA